LFKLSGKGSKKTVEINSGKDQGAMFN